MDHATHFGGDYETVAVRHALGQTASRPHPLRLELLDDLLELLLVERDEF